MTFLYSQTISKHTNIIQLTKTSMHILFFYLYKNALKNQTKNIACQKLNTQQNQAYVYKFH